MSQAIPKYVRTGKNSTGIYAQIKNGNVYKLKAHVATASIPSVIAKIKQAGKIQLKHWECVRTKPTRWEQEEIAHATKMYAFEKSGDKAGAIAYLESRLNLTDEDTWQMSCDSPMVEQMQLQQADSGVAS